MFRRYVRLETLGEELSNAPEETEVFRLARDAMGEIVQKLRSEVVARTPVGASGNLRGSVFSYVRGDIPGELRGVVASRVPYARYVEYGRRPGGGMPPWREGTPLYRWVAHKLKPPEWRLESVSFRVARSIVWNGTAGSRMFARAFRDNQGWIEGRLAQLMDEIARRIGG